MKDLSLKETFDLLKKALSELSETDLRKLSREELMNIICSGCPFFSEEKERLECGAFRIVAALIEKGLLDRDTLKALSEEKSSND
jgi:hypothetical protein